MPKRGTKFAGQVRCKIHLEFNRIRWNDRMVKLWNTLWQCFQFVISCPSITSSAFDFIIFGKKIEFNFHVKLVTEQVVIVIH